MSRTDRFRQAHAWVSRRRYSGIGRAGAVCLGLGLGTAFAADLSTLTIPAYPSGMATDDQVSVPNWRLFDPGFLVDHLPFKLTVGQTISYSDNVSNLPKNVPLIAGLNGFTRLPSRGDFYSDTTISIASQFPMGAQTFFFNGTYAPREYFTDTQLNARNYSVNGGVDFNIDNRCQGRLIGGFSQYQAALDQTAGFGVNDTMSTSFNETASCPITSNITGLFNSGVSRSENSGNSGFGALAIPFAFNNYTQHYVSGGLQYALSGLDTLSGIATFTTRDFDNRPASLGLSNQTQQDDYQFFYSRVFSPKLFANASIGVSVFDTPDGRSSQTSEPVYSIGVTYRATPKVVATFQESKSVGAPQSVIADVQRTETQSLSLSYRYSPKVSVTGQLSRTTSRNPSLLGNSFQTDTGLPLLFTNSRSNNASLILNYSATPLLTATAAYTYSERVDTSRVGFNAVSNVFRVGLFYTR